MECQSPEDDSRHAPGLQTTPRPQGYRILSYDVDGCIGIDGRSDCERVAQALVAFDADLCFLHRIDRGTARSAYVDQVGVLVRMLGYPSYHYSPILRSGSGTSGVLILSRSCLCVVAERFVAPLAREIVPTVAIGITVEQAGRRCRVASVTPASSSVAKEGELPNQPMSQRVFLASVPRLWVDTNVEDAPFDSLPASTRGPRCNGSPIDVAPGLQAAVETIGSAIANSATRSVPAVAILGAGWRRAA